MADRGRGGKDRQWDNGGDNERTMGGQEGGCI